MDIRFISTLTADDEEQMAPALMQAVTALLDALPIAYTLRLETLGLQVFQHTHALTDSATEPGASFAASGSNRTERAVRSSPFASRTVHVEG
jgi:hypothetical protein